MKILKIFIILILTFSCSNEKVIAEFEIVLGAENSQTLTNLVHEFENDFLKKQYPDLNTEMAYRQYLTELENNSTGNWKKPSKKSREIFNSSKLRYEIYRIPDSVWIEKSPDTSHFKYDKSTVKTKWKYLNEDGEFKYGVSESSIGFEEPKNEDSLIELRKKYIDVNYVGKYRRALYSVSKHNTFITEYLDMTDAAGILDPRMVAAKMLSNNVDLNDYFIKRLIITEIAN